MRSRIIPVDPRLDLEILMYPSFAYPLFEIQSNRITKLWGVCSGLTIHKKVKELIVEHNDSECLEYAEEIIGIWSKHIKNHYLARKYMDFVEVLKSEYSWFGIATSSRDDIEIFASIYLSQNTDFHTNVVKWVQKALANYGSVEPIINLDRIRLTKEIGGSYQVLNLVIALKEYIDYRDKILKSSDENSKKYLLRIKGVGPKISHAYLVFVKKSTIYAPIDRNLLSFLSKFEITSNLAASLPRKDMCLKYVCDSCPINISCTYYKIRNVFSEYSAWIQTIAYVHTKLMCRPRRCRECFLKQICSVQSQWSS